MSASKIIAAVDLGTSKALSVVAEVIPGQSISLLGKGEASALGMRKGTIVDFRAACDAVHAALHMSEKEAGCSIDSVYLSVSGRHIEGFFHLGTTAINSPNALVCAEDIARVTDNAKSKALPQGRLYLHHIKNTFLLDGKLVENPLNLHGQRLEVAYWHLHGDSKRVSESINLVNRYGLQVDELIFSGIASAQVAATEEEKKLGCLVLDIGAGTTDYVLFRKGTMARAGTLAVGGDHLTNDLASGLRVNPKEAESLKKLYGKAIVEEADRTETRWLHGELEEGNTAVGNRSVRLATFAQVLQPRLEELFDLLRDELGEMYDPIQLKGGIILTGGTSRLPGIVELAKRRLALDARLWQPVSWVKDEGLKGAEYSAALGLLYSALTIPSNKPQASTGKDTIFNKLSKLFSFTS